MYKIIINGLIDWVDAPDERCTHTSIGVTHETKIKGFDGNIITVKHEQSLFKTLEDEYFHNKFAHVMFVTSDSEITDAEKLVEGYIRKCLGEVEYTYFHRFSDYTGYLWTDEEFKVGGHDIKKLMESLVGNYIHMEIELYEVYEVPDEFKGRK